MLAMSSMTRNFAMGCRRRMNEVDARKDEPEARMARSIVDSGAAAGVGDVDRAPDDRAAPSVPVSEIQPAVPVAGQRVEIAS